MFTNEAGTLATRWTLRDADWLSNDKAYELPVHYDHGVTIEGRKHADKTLEFVVKGPRRGSFTIRGEIPDFVPSDGLHLIVTWGDGAVRFYLEGTHWRSITI